MNEKFCILIQISLYFVPQVPIDDNPALVQIMAWSVNQVSIGSDNGLTSIRRQAII